MSTTTEILFNSPALHSLKREQLVKLCKIHSIKASGKNVDLIHKLRLHAQTLPKDSPLSIAARSDGYDSIPMKLDGKDDGHAQQEDSDEEMRDDASYQSEGSRLPRPSEQWEMVMDSIEEMDEEGSSQGTLTRTGEFGTGGSGSRSTTVSSSIKALATSLGLKRGNTKSSSTSSWPSSSSTSMMATKNPAFSTHQTPHEDQDELSQLSTPYSSLPQSTALPQTDHFTFANDDDTRMSVGGDHANGSTGEPLPGTDLRPGVPAPANARLSMGLGLTGPTTPTRPTTTIRLISNPLSNSDAEPSYAHDYDAGENGTPQLKPFKTSFDITFGSPAPPGPSSAFNFGFGNLSTWPPRSQDDDDQMTGLYPKLSFSDLPPSIERKQPGTPAKPGDVSVSVQHLSAPKSPAADLFVFGTPHKVTDSQFRDAAASVLEDLNRQLREDGVEELGNDIIAKLHPAHSQAKARKESLASREIKPLPGAGSKRGEITDKFDKLHKEEFDKMEGIDSTLRRKNERMRTLAHSHTQDGEEDEKVVVGKKRKSSVIAGGNGTGKGPRRPSGFVPRKASNTRVISNGRRAKALPGAFGDDEDDEDVSDEAEDEQRGGKRVRVDSESAATPSAEDEEKEKKRLELEKEKEAIRKKLESNRAKRRSSVAHGHGGLSGRKSGRVSVGRGPRPSVLVKPKPKPSRFGFLSSAKSLVQSVWNRGKPTPASTAAGPSQIPKPTTSGTSVAASSTIVASSTTSKHEPSNAKEKEKMGPPPMLLSKKQRASIAPARPTNLVATASGSRVPSGSSAASSSTRSRSPLPPTFTGGTGKSKSTTTNVSSIGTRLSTATTSTRTSNIGSMGTKNSTTGASRNSVASRSSAGSSRLYAPTASSLAKMSLVRARSPPSLASGHQRTGSGSSHQVSHQQKPTQTTSTLSSITNSPTIVAAAPSVASPAVTQGSTLFSPKTPGKIFSKPLLLPTQSGIPTPVKKRVVTNETGNVNDTPRAKEDQIQAQPSTFVRTRSMHSLNGRKPRISRSKVIARLASQRRGETSSGSGSGLTTATSSRPARPSALAPLPVPRKSSGKNRSSLGAKVSGGNRVSSGGSGVMLSAKRRVRQSEYYARRKSQRFGTPTLGSGAEVKAGADVDMD